MGRRSGTKILLPSAWHLEEVCRLEDSKQSEHAMAVYILPSQELQVERTQNDDNHHTVFISLTHKELKMKSKMLPT